MSRILTRVPFSKATHEQVVACAKYLGLDERLDIWNVHNRSKVTRTLMTMGYTAVNVEDPDWVIPVK